MIDVQIRIRPRGHLEAAQSLEGRQIKSRLTQAIRKSLQEGKRSGKGLTDPRYTTTISKLGKITSRASGLRGQLKVSGSRNLIKRFKLSPSSRPPHNPPGGLHIQVVRGQGGVLPHAFVNRAGLVFERTGRSRLPIRHLNTVSLAGAWSRVSAKVEAAISHHLEKNLEAII